MKQKYKIVGTGSCLPKLAINNDRFAEIVDTNDEWISSRTGIKNRYLAAGEYTWEMAVKASQNALAMANLEGEAIDAIIVSTMTPDYTSPNLACIIQEDIQAFNAFCFDINAACTGFIQAFDLGMMYLSKPHIHNVLVVAAESLSKLIDFQNRKTCVLFGDGAGAVILSDVNQEEQMEEKDYDCFLGADGRGGKFIVGQAFMPATHPFIPLNAPEIPDRFNHQSGSFIEMQGQDVYRFATTKMPFAVETVLQRAEISLEDIDFLIPHQANDRILSAAAKRLKINPEKVISHIDIFGNTSSASIPICLDLEVREGRIKPGHKVIMTGFGGGLTYGALLCQL